MYPITQFRGSTVALCCTTPGKQDGAAVSDRVECVHSVEESPTGPETVTTQNIGNSSQPGNSSPSPPPQLGPDSYNLERMILPLFVPQESSPSINYLLDDQSNYSAVRHEVR